LYIYLLINLYVIFWRRIGVVKDEKTIMQNQKLKNYIFIKCSSLSSLQI
jgi:hypothetical protein